MENNEKKSEKFHTDKELADMIGILDVNIFDTRNLPPQQRIAVWDKFRRLVEKENREKKSQKIASSNSKRNLSVVQLDNIEPTDNKDASYYTRQQIAKKANVGTGTIARFNRVMNSDDENLKKNKNNTHQILRRWSNDDTISCIENVC